MPGISDKQRDTADLVQFKLRMRETLRAEIEETASRRGNSMNAEIASRLESSLKEDRVFGQGDTRQVLIWLANEIAQIEQLTGKEWSEDLATFEAVALAARDCIERRRPQPDNYEEATQTMRDIREMLKRRDEVYRNLEDCGAAKMEQPNALLRLAKGAYPVIIEDENEWHLPDEPNTPLDEDTKQVVRGWIKEFQEILRGADGHLERLENLQRPIKEAERRGAEIYEEHRRGFDDMVRRALEQVNGA